MGGRGRLNEPIRLLGTGSESPWEADFDKFLTFDSNSTSDDESDVLKMLHKQTTTLNRVLHSINLVMESFLESDFQYLWLKSLMILQNSVLCFIYFVCRNYPKISFQLICYTFIIFDVKSKIFCTTFFFKLRHSTHINQNYFD